MENISALHAVKEELTYLNQMFHVCRRQLPKPLAQ